MKTLKIIFVALLFQFALLSNLSNVASAEKTGTSSPSKLIETTVDQMKTIVQKESGKLGVEQIDEKLKTVVRPVFNFEEMSRRSLGTNWKNATPAEQDEFVKLFSDLLARTYIAKIRRNIENAKISITGEDMDSNKATVKSVIDDNGDIIHVNYRLQQEGSAADWKIFDVIIENIGLVSNYRTEFSGIVRNEKMAGLIQRLRDKKIKVQAPSS